MQHISKITASPVWIMPTSQRTRLHIGILQQGMKRKTDGAHMQAGHHLSSKRQGYYLVKSHGRQWYITMKTNQLLSHCLKVTLMCYTWRPGRWWLFALLLLIWFLLGTSSFSLHSWTTVGECDAISYAFKGEGVWSVVLDTGRIFPFLTKVSLSPLSQFLGRHTEPTAAL